VDFFTTGLPVDADLVTKAKRKYLRGEARYNQASSPWSGNFSVNWLDTDNDNFRDGVFDSSTAANSLELRLKASVLLGQKGSQNHRLTFALDRADVDYKQRGTASPFGDPNQDQSSDVSGYAIEYVGKPAESFSWTLSGRLDDFSDFDDVFTWQLAASHHLVNGIKLRGSVGTGSKAPTFTERYGFFADFFIGNPDLKPETSKGWELGFESDFNRSDVRLGVAWFDQELEDEIDGFVFDPDTFLFTARNKDGKSHRKGVELVLDGDLTDAFSYAGSYTYTKASETDAFGNTQTEVRRPRHMASLSANYRFASDRGNLNLNINYNGSQLDNFFPPPFFGVIQVELESFTVVDFAASWKLTENLELTGRVSNLFDEDYEEVLGFTRPGRAVYAGVRGQFQP
jgi:vitamin B12 transporter